MYNYRNNPYTCKCDNMKQSDETKKCDCGFDDDPNVFPTNYMYGQSYVPIQQMDSTFKPDVGLKMGTLFPELVSPYEPGQSMMEISYLRNTTQNEGQCPNATTN